MLAVEALPIGKLGARGATLVGLFPVALDDEASGTGITDTVSNETLVLDVDATGTGTVALTPFVEPPVARLMGAVDRATRGSPSNGAFELLTAGTPSVGTSGGMNTGLPLRSEMMAREGEGEVKESLKMSVRETGGGKGTIGMMGAFIWGFALGSAAMFGPASAAGAARAWEAPRARMRRRSIVRSTWGDAVELRAVKERIESRIK